MKVMKKDSGISLHNLYWRWILCYINKLEIFQKNTHAEAVLATSCLKEVKPNNSEMRLSRMNKSISFTSGVGHSKKEFNTC